MARTNLADHIVEGPQAAGSAVQGNPVLIGGSDGTNVQALKVGNDGSVSVSLGSNQSVNVAQISGNTAAAGNGVAGTGTQRVCIASDNTAFTVNAAQFGTWTTTQAPAASGGSTLAKVLSAASTNATSVKASAGQLYSYQFTNVNAAFRYVHFYNKASAPTVGTDVPVFTVGVPAGGSVSWSDHNGTPFPTGIAYAITTGAADNDSGAAGANDVMGLVTYK